MTKKSILLPVRSSILSSILQSTAYGEGGDPVIPTVVPLDWADLTYTGYEVEVEAEPEGPGIAAPQNLTWVDGSNPPEFVALIQKDPPHEVQEGDIPKLQFNGGGTIYEGDPVTLPIGNPIFPTMPTLPEGDYTAVLWYDRDEGGPGEVLGDHSDPCPQFTIEESGPTYDTDAQAIFDAFTTPADDTLKGHINTAVVALKSAGIWAKANVIAPFAAAADSQAALVNWKNPSESCSLIGAPSFTAFGYFSFDGVDDAIDSLLVPSTDGGGIYTQDSAHLAIWSGTDGIEDKGNVGRNGTNPCAFLVNQGISTNNVMGGRINSEPFSTLTRSDFTVTVGTGLAGIDRPNAGEVKLCLDDAFLTVLLGGDTASSGLPTQSILFGGDGSTFSARRLLLGWIGGSLTLGEIEDRYDIFLTLFQAVGAVP